MPAISHAAFDRIRQHAAEAYPFECCGALFGDASDVRDVLELPNTTDGEPRRRFLVAPRDYLRAEREASRRGMQLLGFYHSHPDHPARPSQYDLEHAWPVFVYVIIAVEQRVPRDMTAWRLSDTGKEFLRIDLDSKHGGPPRPFELETLNG
jgi:proteasome lid subunit RPN8/RPN11